MTSLIFGSIYLGHKGFVEHKREKQRQKNYQRWEGLRDDYDEQRRIGRESRSLDIQRTGADIDQGVPIDDRPILTLRDQQEANDARLGWRPQESWNDSPSDNRRASVEVTAASNLRPVLKHKTGSTWDEGIPDRIPVSRRNWDEYKPSSLSTDISRSGSVSNRAASGTPAPAQSASRTPPSGTKSPSPLPVQDSNHLLNISTPARQDDADAIESDTPGGRMAELIELGNATNNNNSGSNSPLTNSGSTSPPVRPHPNVYHSSQPSMYSQHSQTPYSQASQTPFGAPSQTLFAQPTPQSPFLPTQQTNFPQHQPSFQGFRQGSYGVGASPTPPVMPRPDGSMHEWWNRG